MADDTDLEILITTTADVSGAEDTKAALDNVGESAANAGEAVAGADKSWEQLNAENDALKMEGGAALGEVGQSARGAGEEIDGAHGHTQSWRRVISQIHHEAPLLGDALHLALHPATAGFAAAVIAIKYAQKAIEDYNHYLELTSLVDLGPMTETVQKQKEAMAAASVEAAKYQAELQRIADKEETITEKTKEAIDEIHRQAHAELEIAHAEQALALAEIDRLEKLGAKKGGISEEEAIKRRLAINKEAALEEKKIEDRRAAETLKAHENELKNYENTEKERLKIVENLQAQVAAATKKRLLDEGTVTKQFSDKNIEEARKHVTELEEILRKGKEEPFRDLISRLFGFKLNTKELEESMAPDIDEASKHLHVLEDLKKVYEKKLQSDKLASALLEAQLQEAKQQEKTAAERIDALKKGLPAERRVTEEETATRATVTALRIQTLETQAGTKEIVEHAREIKRAASDEHKGLAEAKKELGEVDKALAESSKKGAHISETVLIDLKNVILRNNETLAQAHARLSKQVADLERGLRQVNQHNQINKAGAN